MKQHPLTILMLVACLCLAVIPSASGQAPADVLNKTAARLQNSGGLKITFQATSFVGTKENTTANGILLIQGNKFKATTNGATTWYDGHTQWSLLQGSDEVNLTTPTPQEAQQMNPQHFLNLHKSGYASNMKTITYKGKKCHEITLVAKGKKPLQRVLLIVDGNYNLLNIRLRDSRGNWNRFRISNIQTHCKFPETTFRFSTDDYPGIEVIDLR